MVRRCAEKPEKSRGTMRGRGGEGEYNWGCEKKSALGSLEGSKVVIGGKIIYSKKQTYNCSQKR